MAWQDDPIVSPAPTPTGDPTPAPAWQRDPIVVPAPSATPIAASPEGGFQFVTPQAQDVAAARELAPEAEKAGLAVAEQIKGMMPRSATDIAGLINPFGAESIKQRQIADAIMAGGDPSEIYQQNFPEYQDVRQMSENPVLSQPWWNAAVGLGAEGVQMLPFALHAAGAIPSGAEVPQPELPELAPPIGPGGGPAANVAKALQDYDLQQTVASIPSPLPFVSPETGITRYWGAGEAPVMPSETARFADLTRQQLQPPLADQITQQAQAGVAQQQAPLPYTREAADARAAQPQTQQASPSAGTGANVAGFAQTFGPGEIPAGPTITPEDAWDAAAERSATGKAQPYGFVDRAKTGAITPDEMADLIYEQKQLENRAGAAEGTPQYQELYDRARTFAENVVKPAENAWHQKGQVMQIAVKPDFTSETGVRAAADRMGVEIQASDAAKARQIARDNKAAEAGVQVNGQKTLDAMDREYSRGAKRAPKTAEQLRNELAGTDPCVL